MDRETAAACLASDKPRTKPFSIRLTESEKALLVRRAENLPLGVYIRRLILATGERAFRPRQRRTKVPIKDQEALAQVLAALGRTRIANNLNQLAKAVNIGVLPVTPETEADISEACTAVLAIRRDLMQALGIDGGSRT